MYYILALNKYMESKVETTINLRSFRMRITFYNLKIIVQPLAFIFVSRQKQLSILLIFVYFPQFSLFYRMFLFLENTK